MHVQFQIYCTFGSAETQDRGSEALAIRDERGSIFLLRGGAGQEIFSSGRGGAGIKIHGAGHFRGGACRGGAGRGKQYVNAEVNVLF